MKIWQDVIKKLELEGLKPFIRSKKEFKMEVYFYLDVNLRLSKTKASNRKETKEEDIKLRDKI